MWWNANETYEGVIDSVQAEEPSSYKCHVIYDDGEQQWEPVSEHQQQIKIVSMPAAAAVPAAQVLPHPQQSIAPRAVSTTSGPAVAPAEEEEQGAEEEDYQELRRKNIERNKRKLQELELFGRSLGEAVAPALDAEGEEQQPEQKKRKRAPRAPPPAGPTRSSGRARKPSQHLLEARESQQILAQVRFAASR